MPGVESRVHDRLLNWGLWCRGGAGGARGRAASAEGRYDSRAGNTFTNSVGVTVAVDSMDAEVTNCALLQLPHQHRSALQLRYYKNLPDRVICRMLDLRGDTYARFLGDSRLLLHAALQKLKTPVKV